MLKKGKYVDCFLNKSMIFDIYNKNQILTNPSLKLIFLIILRRLLS